MWKTSGYVSVFKELCVPFLQAHIMCEPFLLAPMNLFQHTLNCTEKLAIVLPIDAVLSIQGLFLGGQTCLALGLIPGLAAAARAHSWPPSLALGWQEPSRWGFWVDLEFFPKPAAVPGPVCVPRCGDGSPGEVS